MVTGGVQSRIARTDRTLGEDSLYLPISREYLRRVKHSQGEMSDGVSAGMQGRGLVHGKLTMWQRVLCLPRRMRRALSMRF